MDDDKLVVYFCAPNKKKKKGQQASRRCTFESIRTRYESRFIVNIYSGKYFFPRPRGKMFSQKPLAHVIVDQRFVTVSTIHGNSDKRNAMRIIPAIMMSKDSRGV